MIFLILLDMVLKIQECNQILKSVTRGVNALHTVAIGIYEKQMQIVNVQAIKVFKMTSHCVVTEQVNKSQKLE